MYHPMEFDGLVVEGPNGVRLVAIPTSTLEILQYAEVIQFKQGDRVSRMRVANFLDQRDMRTQEQAAQEVQEADREVREQAANSAAAVASWVAGSKAAGSAPTPEYGAPVLPVHGAHNPSPTPPPAEADPLDPANIPVRVQRGGRWVNIYVTREQYERMTEQGRTEQAPAEGNSEQ